MYIRGDSEWVKDIKQNASDLHMSGHNLEDQAPIKEIKCRIHLGNTLR
jgi:hypothetical protein